MVFHHVFNPVNFQVKKEIIEVCESKQSGLQANAELTAVCLSAAALCPRASWSLQANVGPRGDKACESITLFCLLSIYLTLCRVFGEVLIPKNVSISL